MRYQLSSYARPVGMLALVVIIFSATTRFFTTEGNLYSIFSSFSLVSLTALAVGITIVGGEFDLSVGSMAAFAGVLSVRLGGDIGLWAVPVVAALAGVFGAFQGYLVARLKVPSVVLTLASLIGLRGLAYIASGNSPINLSITALGQSDALSRRYGVLSPDSIIAIVLILVVGVGLGMSRRGRLLHALGGGRAEATAAGVPVTSSLVLLFACSGALAAVAGGLDAFQAGAADPAAYPSLLITAIIAAMVGGVSLAGGVGSGLNIAIGAFTVQALAAGVALRGLASYVGDGFTAGLLALVLVIDFISARAHGSSWGAFAGRAYLADRFKRPAASAPQ